MLEVRALEQHYAGRPVLRLARLKLQQGEQMAILGPSGSGKSTLLHILAGLLEPTQGEVLFEGKALGQMGSAERDRWRGRELGIIFQRLHLLPALSVLQNLQWAQRLARVPLHQAPAMQLLEDLEIADLAHSKPAQISQGQAQRVAVARALVHQPKLLLADEPTSSLDAHNAQLTLRLLQEHAQAAKASLLLVTHDARIQGQLDRELVLEPQA